MQQYQDFLRHILTVGHQKGDRTGTGTISTFGHQMRFDLTKGFPLVTTKKIYLKAVIHELLWFLSGSTNIKYLVDNGVTIWDEWAQPEDVVEKRSITDKDRLDMFCESHKSSDWKEGSNWFIEHLLAKLEEAKPLEQIVRQGILWSSPYDLLARYPNYSTVVFDEAGIPREKNVVVKKKGDLGRVYGAQWRDWIGPNGEHVDQISNLIQRLKTNPDCRRLIVTAWQPAEIDKMALPPCHCFFQFWTRELTVNEIVSANIGDRDILAADYDGDGEEKRQAAIMKVAKEKGLKTRALSCQLYQRSADALLGVPFNIASYALLVLMIAQVCNMVPDEFIWAGGDCHIYSNHMEQVELQLGREPRALPTMRINPNVKNIFDFKYEDFTLEGYDPHPAIKAPVAV